MYGTTVYSLLLLLGLALVADAGKVSKVARQRKRICDNVCKGLSRYLEERILSGDLPALKSNVENYCKLRGSPSSFVCNHFRKNIHLLYKTLVEEESPRKLCRKSEICRKLLGKESKASAKNSCLICKKAVMIVKASLDFVNTTFGNAGAVAKLAYQVFVTDPSGRSKCYKIVNKALLLESKIIKAAETGQLCQAMGFCTNNTETIKKLCYEDLRSESPWSAAMAVMKGMGNFLLSDTMTSSDAIKAIRSNAYFDNLGECLSHVKSNLFKGKSRQVRSIEKPRCQICNSMSQQLLSEASASNKNLPQLSEQVNKLCYILKSPEARRRCAIIASLANSTESMVSGIMNPEVCHQIPCPVRGGKKGEGCDICKKVTKIVKSEMKYVSVAIDMALKQVDVFCKEFGSGEVTAECKKITDSLQKLSQSIIKTFEDQKICKMLGLC